MSINSSKHIKRQTGLVSVTVTIVIMIIVTLVVSSFAYIVRREQRRALNRQLNTQAFSAAEAGINDAFSAINDANHPLTEDIKECTGNNSFIDKVNSLGGGSAYKNNLENTDNIKYSCVLINQNTVKDYDKQVSYKNGSFLVPIHTGEEITSLRLSWEGDDYANPDVYKDTGNYSLPKTLDAPMLRITLFKGFPPDTASELVTPLTRKDLKESAHTMFLSPNSGAGGSVGNIDYSVGADQTRDPQGAFVNGQCNVNNGGINIGLKNAEYDCNVDVNNLSGGKDYYLVVKPLYKDVKFNLRAFNGSSDLNLRGAQVEIEATGKAADILQRVRVRLPVGNNETTKLAGLEGIIPDSALSTSQSICKLWEVKGATIDPVDNCNKKNGGGKGGAGFNQDKCILYPTPECSNPWPGENFSQNNDILRLNRWVMNSYYNPPEAIASCVWDWGDGSTTVLQPGDSNFASCNLGGELNHQYADDPPGYYFTHCKYFDVMLTVKYNNGWPDSVYRDQLRIPIKSSVVGHTNPCEV